MADFNLEEAWMNFQDVLNQNNVPEICLGLMGAVMLALVFAYRKDKESMTYKVLVALGIIFNIAGVFRICLSLFQMRNQNLATIKNVHRRTSLYHTE